MSVLSWRVAKKMGVKWDTERDTLTQKGVVLANIQNIADQFVVEHTQSDPERDDCLLTSAMSTISPPTAQARVEPQQKKGKNKGKKSDVEKGTMVKKRTSRVGSSEAKGPKEERNDPQSSQNISATIPTVYALSQPVSAGTWHERLAHAGKDVIDSVKRTGLLVEGAGPVTHECETCALNKGHRMVSREPPQRATECFERIHFDLIQFPVGFDGSKYTMHFLDDRTRMNYVYLLANKSASSILETIKQFAAYCKRQYCCQIKIFHSDQDPGLGTIYNEWISNEGYQIEWSAVYTPEQNGSAERSGGVIEMKARCLGNGAKLPIDLWPEFVITVNYLINRTPTKRLG